MIRGNYSITPRKLFKLFASFSNEYFLQNLEMLMKLL